MKTVVRARCARRRARVHRHRPRALAQCHARVRSLCHPLPGAGRSVRFGILGPLELATDDGTSVVWRGAKRRGLLALLLVHQGSPLSVDRIVDDLWGEPVSGAANTVQTYLSRLRRVLEGQHDGTLVRRANGYALDVAADALDAARFERLLRDARNTEVAARVGMLRDAVACWRGEALDEFHGAPWADTAAQRLESKRVEAYERLMRSELALGRGPGLVTELETLTARYPL